MIPLSAIARLALSPACFPRAIPGRPTVMMTIMVVIVERPQEVVERRPVTPNGCPHAKPRIAEAGSAIALPRP